MQDETLSIVLKPEEFKKSSEREQIRKVTNTCKKCGKPANDTYLMCEEHHKEVNLLRNLQKQCTKCQEPTFHDSNLYCEKHLREIWNTKGYYSASYTHDKESKELFTCGPIFTLTTLKI